jgi:hypothetical protein
VIDLQVNRQAQQMTPEEIRQMELYYANLASIQVNQQMLSIREEQER